MTDIQRFLDHASTNESLQQEIAEATKDKGYEETAQAVVEFARRDGFNIRIEEAMAALQGDAEGNTDDLELPDDELESVAGGRLGALFGVPRLGTWHRR